MSKIICDICGTSYPETSEQCPICGTVRPVDISGVVSDDNYGEEKAGYTYVKGGRFSKSNVKKRNMAQSSRENTTYQGAQQQNPQYQYPRSQRPEIEEEDSGEGTNKGLIITAIALLVAIILLGVYIAMQFMQSPSSDRKDKTPETTIETSEQLDTEPSTAETTTAVEIPCISIQLVDNASKMIRFNAPGEFYNLAQMLEIEPANTTDVVSYLSKDSAIATVDASGRIDAVTVGETEILVSCGSKSIICYVICDFATEPTEETTEATTEAATEPTEPTTEPTSEPTTEIDPTYTIDDLKIKTFQNSGEITISINELAKVYVGNIPLEDVKIYAKDPSIVKIEGASVVGLRSGTTIVYFEYGDLKQECKVRVQGSTYTGQTGTGHVDNPEG